MARAVVGAAVQMDAALAVQAQNPEAVKLSRRELARAALASTAGLSLLGLGAARAADENKTEKKPDSVPLSEDLNVVQKSKGPILTVLDEFYKMGPGPSSSHTMGPKRITYDFFQRLS